MPHAAEMLERFGVPYEKHVVSAHRTPVWMAEFAQGAEARGIEVIIAGAGGAAHLPGMTAAHTMLPVLGVPVQTAALNGLDSLLSIVQMPGGVPVGTLAIGKAGATNAGLLAVAILAHLAPRSAREAARVSRRADRQGARGSLAVSRVILPGAHHRRAGQRTAGPHVRDCGPAHGLPRPHALAVAKTRRPARWPTLEITADYEDLDAIRAFAKGVHVVTFEFENVSTEAADAAAELVPVRPSGAALHITQQRAREKAFLADARLPDHAVRGRVARSTSWRSRWGRSARRRSSRRPRSATTAKGQHRITSIEDAERVWGLIGHQEAVVERVVDFTHELSVVAARGLDGDVRALRRDREHASQSHPRSSRSSPARVPPPIAQEAVQITRAIMEELDVRRRAVRRVLPHRGRPAAGQRDRAAAAQLGTLHVRCVRHQPVRAAGARRVRAAARRRRRRCGRRRW